MTDSEIIEGLKAIRTIHNGNYAPCVDEAIKRLSAEPCEDCISRQGAINKMQELEDEDIKAYGCEIPEGFDGQKAIRALKTLQPAKTKPKTGRWEHGKELSREYIGQRIVNINYLDWHCSNCHCIIKQSTKPEWNYCPNCGADMTESEVET